MSNHGSGFIYEGTFLDNVTGISDALNNTTDVAGTTYQKPNGGEVYKQITNNSDLLQNNLHSGNQGLITTNDQNVDVKAFVSPTGESIITLTKDDNPDYEHVLWENGKFNETGLSSYVAIGNEQQLLNEIKGVYIDHAKDEIKGKDYYVYPKFLNIPTLDVSSTFEPTEENPNTEEASANYLEYGFGKVDKIIKKLSLRNLTYPLDADFGNTQDYMQINQFKYRPINQELFFGSTAEKKATKNDPFDIFSSGVPMSSPKEEFLGLVKLPMPNSLSDSNNVSWGADQLNSLTAAVSSAVFGQGQQLEQAFRDAFAGFSGGDNFLNRIQGFLQPLLNQGGESIGQAFDQGGKTLNELTRRGSDLNLLGQSIAGSALLNIAQFGITPETILGRGQGVVPNNNLALLFNSPTLREFPFSWKMTPRSREEAIRIRNIIRFFKQGMAPKKGFNTATGASSYFLGTPNVFDIIFKTTRDKYDILNENDAVLRIKTCACTGSAVNYTPDGMWNAYEKGQPVAVTLSLRFSELEPIFDTDYDENLFNYDENRPDLRPVPIDAIGY